MARDLIDVAARDLAGPAAPVPPSRTEDIPLVGAAGWPELEAAKPRLAAEGALTPAQVDRLLGRYGACIHDLLDLIRARPALGRPVDGTGGYLAAEVVYACSHKGALHLEDTLARRTSRVGR